MLRSTLLNLALPLALAVPAAAQVVPTGPFSGALQESFENGGSGFNPCVAGDIFGGAATLCTPGTSQAHITGGWGGDACSISPRTGGQLFGTGNGMARIDFLSPASRFGAYFGNNRTGGNDGSVVMYDAAGSVIYSGTYVAPNDCSWTWSGWEVTSGPLIASVELLGFNGIQRVLLEDLEADTVFVPAHTEYCFGDGSGTACPCGNPGATGNGCANSSFASGAHLSAAGIASISADSLTLSSTGSTPNQPGLFFQGDSAVNGGAGNLLGDGLRCARINVVRLQIVPADGSGNANSSVSISATAGLTSGLTRRYQYWYRDPSAGPCGSGFNLSNGVEAVWVP